MTLYNGGMDSSCPSPQILVVAPNADLRNSLAFMLSAEGLSVEARSAWQKGDDVAAYKAMVIDHASFPRRFHDDGALAKLGDRLLVLASHATLPMGLKNATLVRKPLHVQELLSAVQSALGTPPT